jgi:hypothetical protein
MAGERARPAVVRGIARTIGNYHSGQAPTAENSKSRHVHPRTPAERGANVGPLVNAAAVPEDDDVPAELAEQGAQAHRDLHVGAVAPRIEVDVEPVAPPPGAQGHRRDRRDFVAAIPPPMQHGTAGRCDGRSAAMRTLVCRDWVSFRSGDRPPHEAAPARQLPVPALRHGTRGLRD